MNKLDDTVYMPDEEKRREYVLNDIGKIYIGSHSKPKGRQWVYGQVGYCFKFLFSPIYFN
jgi:hypothetical protein